MTSGLDTLRALAQAIRQDGGLLAAAVVEPDPSACADHGLTASAGPLADGREHDFAFVVEAVREGYLLHYAPGQARILPTEDRDLALLAGDRLYALGLARLAELGALDAVAELTDVIALCAGAHAAGVVDLADAVWEAGAVAVGWGSDDALEQAKDRARTSDPSAAGDLRAAARQLAKDLAR